MTRSVTGLHANDLDHAEWQNGPEAAPYEPAGRTLTEAEVAAEMRRICGPVLDRMRNVEQSAHRCVHGVDLERAGCGPCVGYTEQMGAALVTMLDRIDGGRND